MTERVLITGVRGFTGRHLAARLRRDAHRTLYGIGTDRADKSNPRAATGGDGGLALDGYFLCDLTDAARVERVVEESRPDVVYHLAGVTSGVSPEQIRSINESGFAHLCDSLRRSAIKRAQTIRLLTVGSAAELGSRGAAMLPVREDAACFPETPYGQTKYEVTRRALAEPIDGPLRIIVARAFNLVGPGMGTHLAFGRFAAQIAAFVRGETDALRCGNLASRRDFIDVRDAVDTYVALVDRGQAVGGSAGELYNVSSGRSYEIGELLRQMIALSGIDVPVVVEAAARRAGDLADIYGDPTKTAAAVGRRATTPIERSLADLLAAVLGDGVVQAASTTPPASPLSGPHRPRASQPHRTPTR
jgi:GDP-4-dehydro-6-deoxy-D-mannose reductase